MECTKGFRTSSLHPITVTASISVVLSSCKWECCVQSDNFQRHPVCVVVLRKMKKFCDANGSSRNFVIFAVVDGNENSSASIKFFKLLMQIEISYMLYLELATGAPYLSKTLRNAFMRISMSDETCFVAGSISRNNALESRTTNWLHQTHAFMVKVNNSYYMLK